MCQSERAGAQSWRCRATTITIVIYDTRFLDNYRENFYNGGYHGSPAPDYRTLVAITEKNHYLPPLAELFDRVQERKQFS